MFLTHTPAPPLSNFVSMLWLHDGEPAPHARDRILPTGRIGMVINLQEDEIRTYDRETGQVRRTRGVTVAGACSEYFVIDTAEQRWCMGLEFTMGGAFPFFGMPASELRDDPQVPLDALWGEVDLRGRLLAAASPEAKFRALEAACWSGWPAVRNAIRPWISRCANSSRCRRRARSPRSRTSWV